MSVNERNEDLSIADFFKGKSIFITGGSGFIGKVLIEKLLRSCPDLKNIFMLMRPKRNATIAERMRNLTNVPLFDSLRNENQHFLDKIIPVNGNIKELNLGISEEDRKRIIDNVSIIYHSAASVRFDDSLKDAVLTNVRSTREMMNLAQELKTIDAIVHVSTLYANADNKVIEEKIYPRHDWQDAIDLVERCEENVLQVLTEKYIYPLPNTYTFTKSVAEVVIDDFCKNKIPAVIIRPSIVLMSGCDPVVGWIDNFNGPMGLSIAAGKGMMKTMYCNPHAKHDHVFVDNVVKSIIVATWQKSLDYRNRKRDIMVCNVCSDALYSVSFEKEFLSASVKKNPPETFLWTFSMCLTSWWLNFYVRVLFLHILPALLMDVLLVMSGKKVRIMKIQRQIYNANMTISQLILDERKSKNNNYLSLIDSVTGINKKNFSFFRPSEKARIAIIAQNFWTSCKLYLLKEKPMATKSEVQRYRLFQLAANILKYTFFGFILYLVTWRYSLPTNIYQMFHDYISNFDS